MVGFVDMEPYPDSELVLGLLVCGFLSILTVFWMCLPRAFRQQRPVHHRVAMGLCAGGMVMVLIAVLDVASPHRIASTLEFGRGCAEALGLLMVFDLVAWVRQPSSIPRARVTHVR
jgi:hypothetical protein